MNITFKLIENNKIELILPLLAALDSAIPISQLKTRLPQMIEHGYQCVGIYHKKELIGICGIWILVKYYVGKHLELDNVYIKAEYRNLGIGKKLNQWLINFALSHDCETIELNCYINNKKGNAFWLTNEYTAIGIHYQKKLHP